MFQTEDGWKAEVELIAQLEKRLAVVKGKGTESKPLLQVIGVCNQDYLGPKDDIKIYLFSLLESPCLVEVQQHVNAWIEH